MKRNQKNEDPRMFRYVLRYYIDPGFQEEERIAELLRICRQGRIEEVMLFYNPEELFQGYPPRKEVDAWFSLAGRVRSALSAAAVDMSVNPWTTTVHVSRGRKFSEAQRSFQPMVGETGAVSPITACPLDPSWQEFLGSFFARIAREIAPCAIWVEDDWRLHNHEASMKYGGCFCPLHLARFEEETGIRSSREEILSNILAPGEAHPWRKAWLKVCRDSLLEPARFLQEKVQEANPEVRLGLMSSLPDAHSAEGRDWNLLGKAFSPGTPLLLRPHLPPYTETYALDVSPAVSRQTVSEYDSPLEIYPELENSPRCGKYSKSGSFSIFECFHSALFGSSGITINHYDMMGNGLALDPDFPDFLARAKKMLSSVSALEISDVNSEGAQVLYSPHIAEVIQTERGESMSELIQPSVSWSSVFYKLGISHVPVRSLPGSSEEVSAVSGQTLRAYSRKQIEQLLSSGVILDAPSVVILLERGFGSRIGIRSARWHALDDDGYAYEEIADAPESLYGLSSPRMTASRCSPSLLAMQPESPASVPRDRKETRVLSLIRRYDRSPLYPGAVFHRDPSGGRILSIAYPLEKSQFNMGFFNNFRRIFLHDILLKHFGMRKLLLGCDRPLQTYRIRCGNSSRVLLALLNPTHDVYPELRFIAPGVDPGSAERLGKDGRWRRETLSLENRPAEGFPSLLAHRKLAPLGVSLMRFRIADGSPSPRSAS